MPDYDDPCACSHTRDEHAPDGPCDISGCDCPYFELEVFDDDDPI